MIEHAMCTYLPQGKVFEKQTKTIEKHGGKQTKTINDHGKNKLKL